MHESDVRLPFSTNLESRIKNLYSIAIVFMQQISLLKKTSSNNKCTSNLISINWFLIKTRHICISRMLYCVSMIVPTIIGKSSTTSFGLRQCKYTNMELNHWDWWQTALPNARASKSITFSYLLWRLLTNVFENCTRYNNLEFPVRYLIIEVFGRQSIMVYKLSFI